MSAVTVTVTDEDGGVIASGQAVGWVVLTGAGDAVYGVFDGDEVALSAALYRVVAAITGNAVNPIPG